MTEERYDVLVALLRNKMNVILQGAPGVGKTFAAKKLAYSMMGEVDDSKIELVQFHQNYSYEDFIMGYRPNGAEFKASLKWSPDSIQKVSRITRALLQMKPLML